MVKNRQRIKAKKMDKRNREKWMIRGREGKYECDMIQIIVVNILRKPKIDCVSYAAIIMEMHYGLYLGQT